MDYGVSLPKFEDIVDKIYAAVDESVLWSDVASDIARAAGAASCSMQIRSGGTAKIVGAAGYRDFDAKLYEQQYAPQDMRAQVLMGLPSDEVHLLHHYMPQERFTHSAYYNEFFHRITEGYWSAATWITLDRAAGVGLGIGIHRPRRADPEDSAQLQILSSLSPHLRRAGRLHLKLNDVKTRVSQLSDALDVMKQPAILADSEGRIVIANEAAARLFDPARILGIDSSGKLVTCSPKATRQLRDAIGAAARPAELSDARQTFDIVVIGEDQTPRISLNVLPLQRRGPAMPYDLVGGSIMILAREFAPAMVSVETLRSAFGLSPAEARLVSLLASGTTLKQASQIIGVSYSTVMSQIKACFQKTGTHRQAELVALAVHLGGGRA
ncbi:MAG: LuxR C-terminal-related transcriptional regulator [Dongiaceae bacterium]